MRSLTRVQKFGLLSLTPVYFIVIGLLAQPIPEVGPGIVRIVGEPDSLIMDYFVVDGVGAALINVGILTLMSIGITYFVGMDMDGRTITSSCLMFGFSLFRKNLLNIWAILAEVHLYAKYHKISMRRYIYVNLHGTSPSPIITQLMQVRSQPVIVRLFISIGVGLIIGFVLPPLSIRARYAHKGYSFYNMGFTIGTITTVIVSVIKSFGVEVETRLIWSMSHNRMFGILLSLLFVDMIIFGTAVRGKGIIGSYCKILEFHGINGTDYLRDEGGAATVFNIRVNELFATFFSLAVGGDLNRPTMCGISTIMGFNSTGEHLRDITSTILGVYLASFTRAWEIYQPSPMLALLFFAALAPVAGGFGAVVGMMTGFLHPSVTLDVGIVYGGMNLYNNDYAGGVAAIFMVPVVQPTRDRRIRTRGGLSL